MRGGGGRAGGREKRTRARRQARARAVRVGGAAAGPRGCAALRPREGRCLRRGASAQQVQPLGPAGQGEPMGAARGAAPQPSLPQGSPYRGQGVARTRSACRIRPRHARRRLEGGRQAARFKRGLGRSVGQGGSDRRGARGRRGRQAGIGGRGHPPAPQAARRPANPPGRISSENSEMAYQYFPLSGIRPMPSRSKWRSSSSIHRSRLSL